MVDVRPLFVATTVNYMDRQVLSLTWKDFIAPEFHWTDNDYGTITATFSIIYAICMLFAGKFVDWMGTKKDIFGLSAYGVSEHVLTHSAVGSPCTSEDYQTVSCHDIGTSRDNSGSRYCYHQCMAFYCCSLYSRPR